jgi:MFS family permease
MQKSRPFTVRQTSTVLLTAILVFLTYTAIFAYRKPFTVAAFEGKIYWGIPYQTLLIISQVIGYMLSKFYGIKLIAELKRLARWKISAFLIGTAWLALLFFALVPAPWGLPFLFINGFTLGFMWGITFSYVEGRRSTDFIGSVLAVSFIFAGGFTRSVAVWLKESWQVQEAWLGFATGGVFCIPLVILIFLLEKIPAPSAADIQERTERKPMDKAARKQLLKQFGVGVLLITVTYLFLTIMRDIRDNFMANIWTELGYGKKPAIFTQTETITSVIVLLVMSVLVVVRKNILAFRITHIIIAAGFFIAGSSSLLFLNMQINGSMWMQLTGLGLYMAYIPFNSIFFERFIASFKIAGNVGFLIYIADAWGYLGSVCIMLVKEIFKIQLNWSVFFSNGVVVFSIIGLITTLLSLFYFNKKYQLLH